MSPAARIGDVVATGHPCTPVTPIVATLQATVLVGEVLGAVVGATLDPTHTWLPGSSCVPHPGMIVNTGSTKVLMGGIPAARIGDSADLGAVISGAPNVFIG